jgi:hypothetical protein
MANLRARSRASCHTRVNKLSMNCQSVWPAKADRCKLQDARCKRNCPSKRESVLECGCCAVIGMSVGESQYPTSFVLSKSARALAHSKTLSRSDGRVLPVRPLRPRKVLANPFIPGPTFETQPGAKLPFRRIEYVGRRRFFPATKLGDAPSGKRAATMFLVLSHAVAEEELRFAKRVVNTYRP